MATTTTKAPRLTKPTQPKRRASGLHLYRDKTKKREWRWSFIANGNVMADSAEGYSRRRAARRAWERFAGYLKAGKFRVHESEAK